jgi:hypothetical protein
MVPEFHFVVDGLIRRIHWTLIPSRSLEGEKVRWCLDATKLLLRWLLSLLYDLFFRVNKNFRQLFLGEYTALKYIAVVLMQNAGSRRLPTRIALPASHILWKARFWPVGQGKQMKPDGFFSSNYCWGYFESNHFNLVPKQMLCSWLNPDRLCEEPISQFMYLHKTLVAHCIVWLHCLLWPPVLLASPRYCERLFKYSPIPSSTIIYSVVCSFSFHYPIVSRLIL